MKKIKQDMKEYHLKRHAWDIEEFTIVVPEDLKFATGGKDDIGRGLTNDALHYFTVVKTAGNEKWIDKLNEKLAVTSYVFGENTIITMFNVVADNDLPLTDVRALVDKFHLEDHIILQYSLCNMMLTSAMRIHNFGSATNIVWCLIDCYNAKDNENPESTGFKVMNFDHTIDLECLTDHRVKTYISDSPEFHAIWNKCIEKVGDNYRCKGHNEDMDIDFNHPNKDNINKLRDLILEMPCAFSEGEMPYACKI